jgi:hypothetical protein
MGVTATRGDVHFFTIANGTVKLSDQHSSRASPSCRSIGEKSEFGCKQPATPNKTPAGQTPWKMKHGQASRIVKPANGACIFIYELITMQVHKLVMSVQNWYYDLNL